MVPNRAKRHIFFKIMVNKFVLSRLTCCYLFKVIGFGRRIRKFTVSTASLWLFSILCNQIVNLANQVSSICFFHLLLYFWSTLYSFFSSVVIMLLICNVFRPQKQQYIEHEKQLHPKILEKYVYKSVCMAELFCSKVVGSVLLSDRMVVFFFFQFYHGITLHKKMKFCIKDFLSKCDQICSFLCSVVPFCVVLFWKALQYHYQNNK